MALLLDTDANGWWPVDAATFSIGPGGRHIMVGLLPLAGGACVVHAGWMVAVQRTVVTHALRFGVLDCVVFGLSFSSAAATMFSMLAIALVSAVIWSAKVLICVTIVSVNAFVLLRMLAAYSFWATAAYAIPAMYLHSSSPLLALVIWFALL
jgi:hypothetical protein